MWLCTIGPDRMERGHRAKDNRVPHSREISKREDAQQTGLATSTVADDDQLPAKKRQKTTSVEKLFVDGELTGGCVGGVGRAIALPLRTV